MSKGFGPIFQPSTIICSNLLKVQWTQATPTQNQWYPVYNQAGYSKVSSIALMVNTTAEDLEFKITVNGISYTGAQAGAVAGTVYILIMGESVGDYDFQPTTSAYNALLNCEIEGYNIKIEMRKITASGTGTFGGRVWYKTP